MSTSTLILIACIIIFVVIPSLNDRTIPIKKLLIGPAIFVYLFYESLWKYFPVFSVSYGAIALGVILGVLLGYLLRKSTTIVANHAEQTITVKGSFFTLILFLVIFVVNFVVGYLKAVNPSFFAEASFQNQLLLFALTLVSCLSIGSNGCLYMKYLAAKNHN